jgi:serine protease Do
MNKLRKTFGTLFFAGALAAGAFFGTQFVRDVQFAHAEQQVDTTRQTLNATEDLSNAFRDVAKVVEPSVVEIQVHKTIKGMSTNLPFNDDFLRRFFGGQIPGDQGNDQGDNGDDNNPQANPHNFGGPEFEQIGTGSGVIMEVDGDTAYILTNNHVAGGADEMLVTLADGRLIKGAKTVGTDPKTDLALVKIKADHVIPAKWGDSQTLQKGDWILAFGAPFGYVGSMTHGIVSALNRDVGILRNQQGYENFIQVDAPINPGNSGGPLVNLKGEVVGINTAIASRSGGFQGIGFAIPSHLAKFVYQQLKSSGKVTRGWLGVAIASVDDPQAEPVARSFGYTDLTGVLVQQVLPNTPAAGKLQDGDVITKLDGQEVRDAQQLRNRIASMAPGTEITLSVYRSGKTEQEKIKLGEQPANISLAGGAGPGGQQEETGVGQLGIHLSDITDPLAQRFNLGDRRQGALVTQVSPHSIAASAGLRPGDVITKIGSQTVKDASDASSLLQKADLKKGIRLYVVSSQGSHFIFLQEEQSSQ